MASLSVQPTFPIFTDIDGQPLESGYVWIGSVNLDPQNNPIPVFWDAALTIAAAQPIRTLSGYPANSGTPARLYVNSDYSIRILNKKGSFVYGAPAATERFGNIVSLDTLEFKQLGTGARPRTALEKMQSTIDLTDFAVGDGIVDDTVGVQRAFDRGAAIGACVVDRTGNSYKITGLVTILCDCDMPNSTFLIPADSVAVGVRVGSTTADVFSLGLKLPKLVNTDKTGLGWAGFETAVGFDFGNLYASHIYVPDVRNFGVGMDVGGYGKGGADAGNAYNTYYVGFINDNFKNLRLRVKGTGGFANQNTFIGGDYTGSGAEGPATGISGSYGIELDGVNNNTFLNPSLEAEWNEYQIRLKNSSFNTFISQRLENTTPGRINFHADTLGATASNLFLNGYAFSPYDVTKTGAGTSLYNKFTGNKYADAMQYGGAGLGISNFVGDAPSTPHVVGYSAGVDPITRLATGTTDWSYKLYSQGLVGKRPTDAEANYRVKVDMFSGRLYLGNGAAAPQWFFSGYSAGNQAAIEGAASFVPLPDNTTSLGTGSQRWTTVFATTGAINTSDARQKQQIGNIDQAVLRAWAKVEFCQFKFNDAVEKKGHGARWHFGVVAQRVKEAFESEGLNAFAYGLLCYDAWDAEDAVFGEGGSIDRPAITAGNRYGVRYEEALALECAYLRSKLGV